MSSMSSTLRPDHERLQVLLERGGHGQGPFAMRGATQAVQARLAGQHL